MGLEKQRSKKGINNKGIVYRIQKEKCYKRKSIRTRKKKDFVSRVQNRKQEAMVELESNSVPCREKSTVEQHIGRDSEKYSKDKEQAKGCQKNIQNVERSIAKHWSGESRYI